jgi:hypothetical protein
MNSKSRILLSAALILCSVVPSGARASDAIASSPGSMSRISSVPGMGLSYPTIVSPPTADPGSTVPYSAQRPNGPEAPAQKRDTTDDDNAYPAPSKSSGRSSGIALIPRPPSIERGPAYDNWGQPYSTAYFKKKPRNLTITMLRRPEMKPDQFILRLAIQNLISGCPKLGNLPSKVDFKESSIEITLEDYTVDLRNMTRAPHYACHTRPYTPKADIVLSRDDIAAKGVKQIKLKVGQYTDSYDIDMTAQRIRLMPSSMQRSAPMFKPLKFGNILTPLTHWFYPEGTVILYVPGAKEGTDTKEALWAMAKSEGLEPIQEEFIDFKSPQADPRVYYFIDRKGTLSKNAGIASGVVAGTIPVKKIVYGLEKDEETTEDLQVIARLPSAYE